MTDTPDPIRFTYASESFPLVKRLMIRMVETASGQRRLKRVYQRHFKEDFEAGGCFFDRALEALKLDVQLDEQALKAVPREGPVLFVANHPYGVLDGLALAWIAKKVRPDVKVLAHTALCQAPGAQANLLPVDFSGTPAAARISAASRRDAVSHLKAGGAVGIFPGGGIATSLAATRGPAFELKWHVFTAKMARVAGTHVVPVYFAGQNSRLFHVASHVSATLRLSLIFHETARRMGSALRVAVGEVITPDVISAQPSPEAVVQLLRARTLGLAVKAGGALLPAHNPVLSFELKH